MKGNLKTSGMFRLKLSGGKQIFLVMDESTRNVSIQTDTVQFNLDNLKIEGTAATNQLYSFWRQLKEYNTKDISLASQLSDSTLIDSVKTKLLIERMENNDHAKKFVDGYMDTITNPVLGVFLTINIYRDVQNEWSKYQSMCNKLQAKYSSIPMVKQFCDNVKMADSQTQNQPESLSQGSVAPDISLMNPDGKLISLSSLRGQYVLLDFWASWCGPCRKENPNVVAAYNEFKNKGFTIYSVSLDDNSDKWQNAIEADHLDWPNHVSELKGWESKVCKPYGINSIPMNFILDKEGRIIASNLRGEDLINTLRELIK